MPPRAKTAIEDEVIFLSDRKCVVCQNPGHHLHHIDGNRSNNNIDNLAFLCFADHDQATIKGSLSRKLSPGQIKKYRALHYKKVAHERKLKADPKLQTFENSDFLFELSLDAVVSIEVGKLKNQLSSSDWKQTDTTLNSFYSFPDKIGLRAREEMLKALEEISSRTRDNMPVETATLITNLVTYLVPTKGVTETVSIQEFPLYELGLACSFNITYDGIKYLDNGKHVKRGLEVICLLARYSGFNKRVLFSAFNELDRLLDISDSYEKMNRLVEIYKKSIENKETMYPLLPNEYDNFY